MTLVCNDCKTPTDGFLINGRCGGCHETASEKWNARMAVRQDPSQFDIAKLVPLMLEQHWMHECEIIPDYMPPNPRSDTRPTCVVRYTDRDGEKSFLRYSNGPLQGYFWDLYGDDLHSAELALLCLSKAPPPRKVGFVMPTHGR